MARERNTTVRNRPVETPPPRPPSQSMAERVPGLSDDELDSLWANVGRLEERGSAAQKEHAAELRPLIEAERAKRSAAKAAARPPRTRAKAAAAPEAG